MPNESLLKRLRDAGNDYTLAWGSGELYDEAADEIERLTAALERIRDGIATDRCDGDTEWAAGVNAACHNHLQLVDATIAEGVQPLGHEDDLLALCARLDGDDLRDSDHATAAATIRSLCQQLDAARASAIGGVKGPAHDLYTDSDKDRPAVICEGNGQVTLALCKVCGRGEAELDETCPGPVTFGVNPSSNDQPKGGA